jgi:hypothetical protein
MKSFLLSVTLLAATTCTMWAQTNGLADYSEMNTTKLVAAASKGDPTAIEKFCLLSKSIFLDGASSETYSQDLGSIVDHAGDAAVAAALKKAHLSSGKRSELWNCMEFAHPDLNRKELRKKFPQTSLALGQWFPF